MGKPGIKGTLFSAVIADVKGLLEVGQLSRETLEARLKPGDLALLEEEISPASWYDIFAYHRFVEVLRHVEGGGREDYWYERGLRAARRLIERGIYQQMDYLKRTLAGGERDQTARFNAMAKDLKLILTLHSAMLNFGDWSFRVDPDHGDRYRIEVRGVAGIPDGIFRATAGMISGMASYHRRGDVEGWRYERPEPDLVVYRMTRPA